MQDILKDPQVIVELSSLSFNDAVSRLIDLAQISRPKAVTYIGALGYYQQETDGQVWY